MMRLMSDLLPALIAARDGVLKSVDLRWHDEHALCVVMAAKGYPDEPAARQRDPRPRGRGGAIPRSRSSTPAPAATATGSSPMAAACSASPRSASDLAAARERAYAAVDRIDWPEGFCRRDIGRRATR